jgi:DNA-binding transcriptional ArsR family regulator
MECKSVEKHAEKIENAREAMSPDELVVDLANFLSTFGDSTRIKILLALEKEELCTCDLAEITGLSTSAISHQLRLLKDRKIVKFRKEGRNVFYSLDDEHISEILRVARKHLEEI